MKMHTAGRLRSRVFRVAVALLFGVGLGRPAAAEPLSVVISYSVVPAQFTPFVFSAEMRAKKDVLRHLGKSYDVEVVRMTGAGQGTAALAAGRLHIEGGSYQGFANAVLQAKLDVRVISDLLATGRGENYSPPMIVRKDSGIKTAKDLKGKRLAILARNSGFDAAVRVEMRKHGFAADKDYTIVEVPPPNMIAGLQQKLFDAAMPVPPFTITAERTGEFHTVFKFRDALGATQTAMLWARKGFLDKNAAAMKDFMEDYVRSWRYLNDPKNRDELIKIVANFMKGTPAQYAWVNTKDDEYRDPWAVPDLEMLQKNIDDLAREKLLVGTVKVAEHADLSFVHEARRRIEAGK